MPTIDDIIAFGERLCKLRHAASRQGLAVGELLGHGGYGVVFSCSRGNDAEQVLKLPLLWPEHCSEHPDLVPRGHGPHVISQVSVTGPFVLRGVRSEQDAQLLLEATLARQLARPCAVLPRLIQRLELEGTVTAVYERLRGTSLRRSGPAWQSSFEGLLVHLSEALLTLHRDFGPHGDLKPEHILCSGFDYEVRLIDPLPLDTPWIGSVGYTLGRAVGIGLAEQVSDEELARAQDVGALVPILAEQFGVDVGWSGRLLFAVVNRFNGRFGQGFEPELLIERLDHAIQFIPEGLRTWLARVGRDIIGLYSREPWKPVQSSVCEGWSEARLRELGALRVGG